MLGNMSNVTVREHCHFEAKGHIAQQTGHHGPLLSRMTPPPTFLGDKNINPSYMAMRGAFSILHLTLHPGP